MEPKVSWVPVLILKWPETGEEDPERLDLNHLTSETQNKEAPQNSKQKSLAWGPWDFCVQGRDEPF